MYYWPWSRTARLILDAVKVLTSSWSDCAVRYVSVTSTWLPDAWGWVLTSSRRAVRRLVLRSWDINPLTRSLWKITIKKNFICFGRLRYYYTFNSAICTLVLRLKDYAIDNSRFYSTLGKSSRRLVCYVLNQCWGSIKIFRLPFWILFLFRSKE